MQTRQITSPSVARALLLERTRSAHQALHDLANFRAFVSGKLDRDGYGHLLSDLYGFYLLADPALTAACARFDSADTGYTYQPRSPLFAQDLHSLGVDGAASPCAAEVLPELTTPAALAGTLYVIEGSLLGGATLDAAARRVLMAADGGDARGRRYWAWCRDVGALRWQATNVLLEQWLATPARTHTAIAAACTTFNRLHAWMLARDVARC